MDGISRCVQCGRCSSGCPVAFEADRTPRGLIRLLQLGDVAEARRSRLPWFCATCHACTVRCPQGVPVLEIMLALRRTAEEAPEAFYRLFMDMVTQKGRISEGRLGFAVSLRTFPLHPVLDVRLLHQLWQRGKI